MTDNVTRAEHYLKYVAGKDHPSSRHESLEKGGGGGDSGGMDEIRWRVSQLEKSLEGAKASLSNLEVAAARIEAKLGNLASSDWAAAVSAEVKAMDGRVGGLETTVRTKLPSWWQVPTSVGLVAMIMAAVTFLIRLGIS